MRYARFTTALLAIILMCAAPQAVAQDDEEMAAMEAMMEAAPSTVMSFWQCDIAHLDEIVRGANTYQKPAAQELIDEGMITNWGLMVHSWGDEWNVVFHTSADDEAALMSANTEMNLRATALAEAAGEDIDLGPPLLRHCTAHKDNFYTNAAYIGR
jgi:hypothetical protein